eukprot:s275_g5.t1
MCNSLVCTDVDTCAFSDVPDLAWRCEIPVFDRDIQAWKQEQDVTDLAFVVSAAKRQRSEVRLSTLTNAEKLEFKKAKMAEVQNWIKTGTISKILREQVPHDQILRSFDIRAAFLQGKPQKDRTLAIEPVEEIIEALQLTTNQVCKLEKGAYGLVDAPFQWFLAISEELRNLGFLQSPFDPCQFILRHHEHGTLEGILGLHVDDGICGGSDYFAEKIATLEKKYPFGSKKLKRFTFTGIEMDQLPNGTITMTQSTYVKAINPIKITSERRQQPDEKVTEDERQALRGLIGSLQYAAVHTRPDLARPWTREVLLGEFHFERVSGKASGCTRLHQAAPGCTRLHQAAPGCTRLHQAAPGCKAGFCNVLRASRSYHGDDGNVWNLTKGAVMTCDRLLTVSEGYAEEMKTAEGGFRLDELVKQKEFFLSGILNGIDVVTWNPRTDPYLAMQYDFDSMPAGKAACKRQLQEKVGLHVDDNKVLVSFVGRLTTQKGVDIILEATEWMMEDTGNNVTGNIQVLMMGNGDEVYVKGMQDMSRRYPGRFVGISFDPAVEHVMYAGSDFLLMPSRRCRN